MQRHKILVVDDDLLVVKATMSMLAAELPACELIGLNSSAEAMIRVRTPDLSVILCDLSMPDPDGVALLREARRCNPGIVTLLVTGYATKEALLALINDGSVWKCLEKPCIPNVLIQNVRAALKTAAFVRSAPAIGAFPAGNRLVPVRKPGRPAAVRAGGPQPVKRPVVLKKRTPAPPPRVMLRRGDRAPKDPLPLLAHKRYRDLELIAKGGSASVYKARDVLLNTPVAIKLISQKVACNPRMIAMLLSEARLAMQLSHRHIVRLHNIEETNATYFLVMEYIGGPTLRTLLTQRGRLPPDMVRQVLGICEDALDYAHRRNILHRDIKPENLILTEDGVLKIIDFGIACLAAENARQRDEMCGTPYYLSPEEVRGGPLDCRTDLYALGVVLHELLTGSLPDHDGDIPPEDAFHYIPSASESVPEPLRTVLNGCFAINPEARWPDIHTFAVQFRTAYDDIQLAQGPAWSCAPDS